MHIGDRILKLPANYNGLRLTKAELFLGYWMNRTKVILLKD